ncbi:unnamed protein product [Aureobasidium vineae]|uniref:Cutinase n=1 Tax=Aureobasidium vineae TaxID=2773715 RepID=A0A9N8JPT0_9PEZI|nr:unnamed protein product [Aureobasidium vineae]
MHLPSILLGATISGIVTARPIDLDIRQASCPSYSTGEPQGPSAGFQTMNTNVLAQKPGGRVYSTIYPADVFGITTGGTQDIINHIHATLASNPAECFILQGYSQGATAVVKTLPQLTGPAFDAVKAVLLIGNPFHKAGLECNVDSNGGTLTKDVNGVYEPLHPGLSVPSNWVSKTKDVCAFGDFVCDTRDGPLIAAQHLSYPFNPATQDMGTAFSLAQLNGSS